MKAKVQQPNLFGFLMLHAVHIKRLQQYWTIWYPYSYCTEQSATGRLIRWQNYTRLLEQLYYTTLLCCQLFAQQIMSVRSSTLFQQEGSIKKNTSGCCLRTIQLSRTINTNFMALWISWMVVHGCQPLTSSYQTKPIM